MYTYTFFTEALPPPIAWTFHSFGVGTVVAMFDDRETVVVAGFVHIFCIRRISYLINFWSQSFSGAPAANAATNQFSNLLNFFSCSWLRVCVYLCVRRRKEIWCHVIGGVVVTVSFVNLILLALCNLNCFTSCVAKFFEASVFFLHSIAASCYSHSLLICVYCPHYFSDTKKRRSDERIKSDCLKARLYEQMLISIIPHVSCSDCTRENKTKHENCVATNAMAISGWNEYIFQCSNAKMKPIPHHILSKVWMWTMLSCSRACVFVRFHRSTKIIEKHNAHQI